MAKCFFDCHEYDRCAATLLPSLTPQQPVDRGLHLGSKSASTAKGKSRASGANVDLGTRPNQPPRLSQKSLFLALYAKYIAGEKRKEEDSELILGPLDGPVTSNKELTKISAALESYLKSRGGLGGDEPSDGFLEYLYAVVLIKGKNEQLAQRWLLKSVSRNQWNWSAWQELADTVGSVDEVCASVDFDVRANTDSRIARLALSTNHTDHTGNLVPNLLQSGAFCRWRTDARQGRWDQWRLPEICVCTNSESSHALSQQG